MTREEYAMRGRLLLRWSPVAMKEYLQRKLQVGKAYTFTVSSPANDGETVGKTFWLMGIYPNICTFEDNRGLKTSFPLYETIHLLKGERWTNGKYPGEATPYMDEAAKIMAL